MTSLAAKFSAIGLAFTALVAPPAVAGPVFLTGHDPDFHAQSSIPAQNLLNAGLSFVTGGAYTSSTKKFLWVESFLAPTAGHLVGEDGLGSIGLTLGTHYDWVNAAGFATVNLSDYEAIGVASSFGGMLTQAELDALVARKADIATFVNGGGGLLALSECFPSSSFCLADTLGPNPDLFGFLPITVTSVVTAAPYAMTAAGVALFPSLTNDDFNDPTHNSFGSSGGLTIVDTDQNGVATTLAGNVRITDTGFVPEPGSISLMALSLAGLAAANARRRRKSIAGAVCIRAGAMVVRRRADAD